MDEDPIHILTLPNSFLITFKKYMPLCKQRLLNSNKRRPDYWIHQLTTAFIQTVEWLLEINSSLLGYAINPLDLIYHKNICQF